MVLHHSKRLFRKLKIISFYFVLSILTIELLSLINDSINESCYIDVAKSWYLIPTFIITGIIAGIVDSIAGGGGLVTVPVLLGVGLPPQLALGTNKFQSSFGSFTAATNYVKNKIVPIKDCYSGILLTVMGALTGTWALQQIDTQILKTIIPVLLIIIAVYTLVSPEIGIKDKKAKLPLFFFYLIFGISLGFYDGFFGPGVGSFWVIAFILFSGFNMTKATGYTKVMNFTSNMTSLCVFYFYNHISFSIGLCMACGQVIGARIGSNLVIAKGNRFIKPIFIAVITATTIKLLCEWGI